MSVPSGVPEKEDIARVAHAIWEAEGRPEGRDHEHWTRAKQLIAEGRAEDEFPGALAGDGQGEPRPVQPGFEDAAPGMTPKLKPDAERELPEEPGGRFFKQLAEAPEKTKDDGGDTGAPGPRDPAPEPPTNADGYVAISSVEDNAGRAVADDPQPPPAEGERRAGRGSKRRPARE